jgi:hypothetical protein
MSRLQTNAIRHLDSAVNNMTLDNAGRVLRPYQPVANITWNNHQPPNDYLGKASNTAEVNLDVGTRFNTSTGQYSCPVAGVYRATFTGMNHTAAQGFVYLKKNGATVGTGDTHSTYSPAVQYAKQAIIAVISCAANDTLGFWNQTGYTNVHSAYGQLTFELIG